ncbi:MAG: hypothetical protein IPM14_16310 [bacterium]|nr:hypothetical protein [bacterium]
MGTKKHYSKCPVCGNEGELRNSRARNTKERIIKYLTWYELYRCKKCGWRGWKANFTFNKSLIKTIVLYLVLMVIAAIIVYNILKLVV